MLILPTFAACSMPDASAAKSEASAKPPPEGEDVGMLILPTFAACSMTEASSSKPEASPPAPPRKEGWPGGEGVGMLILPVRATERGAPCFFSVCSIFAVLVFITVCSACMCVPLERLRKVINIPSFGGAWGGYTGRLLSFLNCIASARVLKSCSFLFIFTR